MTELVLSDFASPLLGRYTQPPRNTRNEDAHTKATKTRESPSEVERVVSGEVLTASESTYSHLNNTQSRFSQSRDTASGFTEQPRRHSMQAAIQIFRDNEAMVVEQNRAVQVSGIIDEYA